MQTIVQSNFLQALAYALLNSMWQMGLLWLAIIFIFRFLKLSSSQKFTVAYTAHLLGFIAFLYVLITSYISESSFQVLTSTGTILNNDAAIYFSYAMRFIAASYVLVLSWNILKLAFNYKLTQDLRNKNLVKIPAANRVFVEELVAIFTLHKKVKIYLSKTVKCPVTIGFFKPVILIPLAAINHLTQEQMEAVILHELAHIKRDDYLLNLLQYVISRVFFFNIFSKMIDDIIERERENSCDDCVVQFKYNSFHYAEALLKIARLQTFSFFAMAASGKNKNILLQRVKRLIHPGQKTLYQCASLRFSFLSLIITAGLIISFFSKPLGVIEYSNIPPKGINASEKNINQNLKDLNSQFTKSIAQKNIIKPVFKKNKIATNNTTTGKLLNETSENLKLIKKENQDFLQKAGLNYFASIEQTTDSLKRNAYTKAVNKQFAFSTDAYKKVLSYQNFKQLETMLSLTGDSVIVTEDPDTKNNYKRLITIETTDKDGNTNIYQVVVELYQ